MEQPSEDCFWINLARMGGCSIKQQVESSGVVSSICAKDGAKNTDVHCVVDCGRTKEQRRKTGTSQFFSVCKLRGISVSEAYRMFIEGQDVEGNDVTNEDYRERGRCLAEIFENLVINIVFWFSDIMEV